MAVYGDGSKAFYNEFNTSTDALGASSWIDLQINASTVSKTILQDVDINHSVGMCRFTVYEATTNTTAATGSAAVTLANANRN
jgi:hypothetical protein